MKKIKFLPTLFFFLIAPLSLQAHVLKLISAAGVVTGGGLIISAKIDSVQAEVDDMFWIGMQRNLKRLTAKATIAEILSNSPIARHEAILKSFQGFQDYFQKYGLKPLTHAELIKLTPAQFAKRILTSPACAMIELKLRQRRSSRLAKYVAGSILSGGSGLALCYFGVAG